MTIAVRLAKKNLTLRLTGGDGLFISGTNVFYGSIAAVSGTDLRRGTVSDSLTTRSSQN